MEDEAYCKRMADEAYREAEAEPLANARRKLLAAAEAWEGMARWKRLAKPATAQEPASE